MLLRVLDAVNRAEPAIVVGPQSLAPLLPRGTSLVQEEPPGGGPVAGLAAGARLVPPRVRLVAVLSADLPFLHPTVLDGLCGELDQGGDVAVLLDGSGRPQWLCSVWRRGALLDRLASLGDGRGTRMRDLAAAADVRRVSPPGSGPPPWFDCDTEEDFRRAEELVAMNSASSHPTTRMTLDEWIAAVCTALNLSPERVDRALILDLARETAHGVARPAAPVTTYLAGLAVGQGADLAAVAATIRDLAQPPSGRDDITPSTLD